MPGSVPPVSSKRAAALAGLLALALLGCRQREVVHPAMWEVRGPHGEQAWLLGTIHALPGPVTWRTPAVDKALQGADRIVLEVANVDDDKSTSDAFTRLAMSQREVPLRDRISAAQQPAFDRFIAKYHVPVGDLSLMDTWAGALVLAQYALRDSGSDKANGIDRAVKAAAGARPVEQFEGADAQLRIFDALPEAEQRDLLAAVVSDEDGSAEDSHQIEQAWAKGNLAAIEQETRSGMLADPELRAALLTGRNAAWTGRMAEMLTSGERPFVAVGAAHLAGPDGLPAMLAARGYTVTRVQ